jgi:hypothetical protein
VRKKESWNYCDGCSMKTVTASLTSSTDPSSLPLLLRAKHFQLSLKYCIEISFKTILSLDILFGPCEWT